MNNDQETDLFKEVAGYKWYIPKESYRNLPLENHEHTSRDWVRKSVPKGGLFIDIGANSGSWAITMADHFDMVVAVEPHPMNLLVLHKNIELNELQKKIRVEPIAAWSDDCWLHLNWTSVGDYSSDIIAMNAIPERSKAGSIHTLAKKIDSLDLAPTFVKIDVEGAELEVIKGMKQTMLKYHPTIHLEVHRGLGQFLPSGDGGPDDKEKCRDAIESLGYDLIRQIVPHQVFVEKGKWKGEREIR